MAQIDHLRNIGLTGLLLFSLLLYFTIDLAGFHSSRVASTSALRLKGASSLVTKPVSVSTHAAASNTRVMAAVEAKPKQQYSLWFEPSGALKDQLSAEIKALSDEYPSAARFFHPHVTLIGAVECTEDEIMDKARHLASTAPFVITLEKVSTGSIYFQTVYLLAQTSSELMQIGTKAREMFGWTGDKATYMPHLSLIYNDMSKEDRERLAERSHHRLFNTDDSTLKKEGGFEVTHIAVYLTDPNDKSTLSWKKVADVPLLEL